MLETQSATNKSVTSISEALTFLKEYSELRWQKSLIEAKLSEITGLSIQAAQLIVEKSQCVNGKRIVYRDGRSEITLQFKTQSSNNNPQLKKLQQRIDSERDRAIRKNDKAIALLQEQITFLEGKIRDLSITSECERLIEKYEFLSNKLKSKEPILSVKLK